MNRDDATPPSPPRLPRHRHFSGSMTVIKHESMQLHWTIPGQKPDHDSFSGNTLHSLQSLASKVQRQFKLVLSASDAYEQRESLEVQTPTKHVSRLTLSPPLMTKQN